MSATADDLTITSERVRLAALVIAASNVVDTLTDSGVCEVCGAPVATHADGCALATLETAIREATYA